MLGIEKGKFEILPDLLFKEVLMYQDPFYVERTGTRLSNFRMIHGENFVCAEQEERRTVKDSFEKDDLLQSRLSAGVVSYI